MLSFNPVFSPLSLSSRGSLFLFTFCHILLTKHFSIFSFQISPLFPLRSKPSPVQVLIQNHFIIFSYHVAYLVSLNLDQFHSNVIIKEHRPVFCEMSHHFSLLFLIRFRLCVLDRHAAEVMCPSQGFIFQYLNYILPFPSGLPGFC